MYSFVKVATWEKVFLRVNANRKDADQAAKVKKGQHTTEPTLRLVRPAKTQIRLRIRAVWSESSLIACATYSLRASERGINENPCYNKWLYRLIWVFAAHTDLIVGFVVRWLISLIRNFAILRLCSTAPKDSISGQRMRSLIWAFAVHICPKTRFRVTRTIQ